MVRLKLFLTRFTLDVPEFPVMKIMYTYFVYIFIRLKTVINILYDITRV